MRILMTVFALLMTACSPSVRSAEGDQARTPMARSPIQRCMNMGNALDSPRIEGEWGYKIRRQDLELLRDVGFDSARIPIRWSARTGMAPPYRIDPAFFGRVDEIVDWGGEIGLNIIINVHHYDALSVRPDIHEARLEAIWDQIADHYAGAPDYLIFETVNEPFGEMTVKRTDALNRRILERIRQDNPGRWVILGTAQWSNLDGLTESDPPYDRRAILTYHDYNPFEFTHQGAFWTDPVRPTGVRWGTRKDLSRLAATLDKALAVQERL
ncbi:MAG: glycoside hydrolase family 5 protein, partial [Henriciella sp.]|nr:glycoside hydrolase family 5 protein [Henriciella sp.]